MAEQPAIVADPMSSDESEDSWIMLDEMDEAMNDIDGVVNQASVQPVAATTVPEISIETAELATETYQPSRIEEVYDKNGVNGIVFEPKIETISCDPIDTCPSDDNSDSEHMYSSRPYDRVSLAPTIDDGGSTTDGSISMVSDTEFHRYETKPKRKYLKDGKDRLDMLMNCRPIDMTVKNPRPTVQIAGRCAMPTSVEELAMGKPCFVDEIIHFLERLNNFFASTYMGQVFLLFVTILSLISYSIMYNRYTNIKLNLDGAKYKYRELEVQLIHTEVNLAQCEHRYDRELKHKNFEPNVPKSIVTEEDHKTKTSATNLETKYKLITEYETEFEDIHPTKLRSQFEAEETFDKTKTISAFDKDDFQGDFVKPSIPDHRDRIYNRVGEDESDSQNQFDPQIFKYFNCDSGCFLASPDSIYFQSDEDNSDIHIEATSKYESTERDILREDDWNNNAAQKYKHQDAHIHHTATKQHKPRDESKSRKEEKKMEKTKTKFDIEAKKFLLHDEKFGEKKLKYHNERKLRLQNENKNKDRKESKEKEDRHAKKYGGAQEWRLFNL